MKKIYMFFLLSILLISRTAATSAQDVQVNKKPEILLLDFVLEDIDQEKYPLFGEYFEKFLNEEAVFTIVHRDRSVPKSNIIVSAKRIGQEENVQFVVAGRIKKAGNRIQVTSYLVNSLTGRAEYTYTRKLKSTIELPMAAKENAFHFAETWKNYNKKKKLSTSLLVPGLTQIMYKKYVRGTIWMGAAATMIGYYIHLHNSKEFRKKPSGLVGDDLYYIDGIQVSGVEYFNEKDKLRNKKVTVFAALVITYAGSIYDAVKIKKNAEKLQGRTLSYGFNFDPKNPAISLSVAF